MSRDYRVYLDDIIHQYFAVDTDIIGDIVKNKLPLLRRQVAEIIAHPDFP